VVFILRSKNEWKEVKRKWEEVERSVKEWEGVECRLGKTYPTPETQTEQPEPYPT